LNYPSESIFNSGSKLLLCHDDQQQNGDCIVQNIDIIFDARGGKSGALGVLYGKHCSFIFLFNKINWLATLAGRYDFSSYSGSGDVEDEVSTGKAVFSPSPDVPAFESDELKFKNGNEYIQLADFSIKHDDLGIYTSSSVTVSFWIKLEEAPASSAYIFRCQLAGETVRI